MDLNWDVIIAIICSGAFGTVVSTICHIIERKKDDENGIRKALRLILKNDLRKLCIEYIDQGWIYADELEDAIAMHNMYHDGLNGNGYLDTLTNKVKNLEIRGDEHNHHTSTLGGGKSK